MNRRSAIAFTIPLLLTVGVAGAQSSSNPGAEQLFREARALMDARKYAEACPKFVESQKLEPAAGTILNLADCYEKNGQTASAWLTYKEAAKAAVGRNRADWVQTAMQRTAALEPKVAYWTITVPSADTPSLRVERDGVVLRKEEWGTAIASDPGPHVVVASAPGRKPFTARIEVIPAKKLVTEIPALEADTDAARPVAETPKSAPPPAVVADNGTPMRTVGWIVAGVGAVALGVGTFTGVRALGLRSDAKSHCDDYPSVCGPEASGPNDDAHTFATISTISLVAGVALVAAGIVLVVTSKGHVETHAGLLGTRF